MTPQDAARLHSLVGRPAWAWSPLSRLGEAETSTGVALMDWDPRGGPTAESVQSVVLRRVRVARRRQVTR